MEGQTVTLTTMEVERDAAIKSLKAEKAQSQALRDELAGLRKRQEEIVKQRVDT